MSDLLRYLDHLYGDRKFYIQVCTLNGDTQAWDEGKPVACYPGEHPSIERQIKRISDSGLNAYVSAHGYIDNRRGGVKANADRIDVLWVEADEAPIPTGDLRPTMIVETSPGRYHYYWRLSRRVAPSTAEELNRRLTAMLGGDSGYALTKRLRPPETINYQPKRRPGSHTVRLVEIDDARDFDPTELDEILPELPPAPKVDLSAIADASGEEPPFVLPPSALAVWRGLSPAKKPNGDIDRSRSLYEIGVVLHEYGATPRTVIAELAARDMSIGWNRYTDHPEEYARIAAKVEGKPRKIGPVSIAANAPRADFAGSADEDACDIRLARAIAENDQLRAELHEVKELNHLLIATLNNPNIDGLGVAVVRTVMHVAHERRMGRAQPDGSVKATARKIGADNRPFDEHAPILPASTAYAHSKRLEKLGLVERKIEPAQVWRPKQIKGDDGKWQTVRDASGKIEYEDTIDKVTFLNIPGETINDMLRPIAFFAPPPATEPGEVAHKPKRGGDRRSKSFRALKAAIDSAPTCPHCGDDELRLVCSSCGCTVSAEDLTSAADAEDRAFKLETARDEAHQTNPPDRMFQNGSLSTGGATGAVVANRTIKFETHGDDAVADNRLADEIARIESLSAKEFKREHADLPPAWDKSPEAATRRRAFAIASERIAQREQQQRVADRKGAPPMAAQLFRAPTGSVTDAWQRAAPMPGTEPTPLDDLTDVAIGGRA